MKRVGLFVEDTKFIALRFRDFINIKRPDSKIQFIQIPDICPLVFKEPFDLIIHKSLFLRSRDEKQDYEALLYSEFTEVFENSPSTYCIDNFKSIDVILDRFGQYEAISRAIDSFALEAHVLTPKFCYCEGDYNKDLASFQRAGLKFPAVCKPLTAHGGDNAHKMIIFFKRDDLCHIELPAVLQNFENHNGFLLKAYVIGDFFHLVTRPSVKNLPLDHDPIVFNSHNVSKASSKSILNEKSIPSVEEALVDTQLIRQAVEALRANLNLQLFGVDFIVLPPATHTHKLAIIDVNIFPDYSCVPNFFFHLENLARKTLNVPLLKSPLDFN